MEVVPGAIRLDDENLIEKRYNLRKTGREGRSIETTIPREVLAREAKRLGLTVEEALHQLDAVWRYDSFRGLLLTFEAKTR